MRIPDIDPYLSERKLDKEKGATIWRSGGVCGAPVPKTIMQKQQETPGGHGAGAGNRDTLFFVARLSYAIYYLCIFLAFHYFSLFSSFFSFSLFFHKQQETPVGHGAGAGNRDTGTN